MAIVNFSEMPNEQDFVVRSENEGAFITIKKEANYETEEILSPKERLNEANNFIGDVGDTGAETPSPIELDKRSNDMCHMTNTDSSGGSCYAREGGEDLVGVTKYGKHFGGCLKLECGEETTSYIKSELVESEANMFKVTGLQNTEYFGENDRFRVTELGTEHHGNLKLECDAETELSEVTPVVNIVPILDHETDTGTDDYNGCQATCSNKRIKLERADSDEGNPFVSDTGGRICSDKGIKLELADSGNFNPSVGGTVERLSKRIKLEVVECDEANQSIGDTVGGTTCNKIIKFELPESDGGNQSIQDGTCTFDDNPVLSGLLGSSNVFGKPSDSPNLVEKSKNTVSSPQSTAASKVTGLNCQRCPEIKCHSKFLTTQALNAHIKKKHPAGISSAGPSAGPSTGPSTGKKVVQKKADSFRTCPVCRMHFSERLSLCEEFADHLKIHYPKLHSCDFCGQAFTRKDSHERHLAFHKDRPVHYCHICGAHFKSMFVNLEVSVRTHMESHKIKQRGIHPVPEFLTDHVKINSNNPQPYTCNICGMGYKRLPQLLTHLVNHSDEGRHSCIVCARECLWEADVHLWMCKSHPDICNICRLRNLYPKSFDAHRKKHYGTFHNCEKCDQGFVQEENLQKHVLSTHSKHQKSHVCHICDESMNSDVTKEHMDRHRTKFNNGLPDHFNAQIKMQGENKGLLVCNLCGYSGAQVQPLISHLLEHIKSEMACPKCGIEFISSHTLKYHVANSNCCVASQEHRACRVQRQPRVEPPESHFGALHTCPFCQQNFHVSDNLVKHKKVFHYGKSQHPCLACDAFLPLGELKSHIKQVHAGLQKFTVDDSNDLSLNIMTYRPTSGHRTSYICGICGTFYFGLKTMHSHLHLHQKFQFSCNFCGTEFAEADHLSHHHSSLPAHK